MKMLLKLFAAPFLLILTLLAAIVSFLSCVGSIVCNVVCTLLTLLALVALITQSLQNSAVIFVLAFLISPFGFPAIGTWMLDRLYSAKFTLQDFMTS